VIAVLPVRDGSLPDGADGVVAEAVGRVLLIGEHTLEAAESLLVSVVELWLCEAGPFAPATWSAGLVDVLGAEPHVVLPTSPDGRDLAGRLAAALGRVCHTWCTSTGTDHVVLSRFDGAQSLTVPVDEPYVATLLARRLVGDGPTTLPTARGIELAATSMRDPVVIGIDDADPGAVDLTDATRIVAGGVGLGDREAFRALSVLASALHASLGATRPIADRGIVGHERQIGTTGMTVDPDLYLAFGISGAVQHTAGLGQPRRVIAVNTDASCPMMAMSDLALVADAPSTVVALTTLLDEGAP
jgi:electron transfer flavoprotein alpha subunit